jgi:hypothetical protein
MSGASPAQWPTAPFAGAQMHACMSHCVLTPCPFQTAFPPPPCRNEALHVGEHDLQVFLKALHNELDTVAVHPDPVRMVRHLGAATQSLSSSSSSSRKQRQQQSRAIEPVLLGLCPALPNGPSTLTSSPQAMPNYQALPPRAEIEQPALNCLCCACESLCLGVCSL